MRKPKPPKIVGLIILTTVTIVFWVFYGLYSTLTKTPPVDIPKEILSPIDPQLDISLLDSIINKEFYDKGETLPLIDSTQQQLQEDQQVEISPIQTTEETP